MAGWLSRAKSLFRQPLPPAPVPFEVECDCGGKVVGQRAANYLRPTCPVCERPVFVLPLNVYPSIGPKTNPKTKSPGSAASMKSTGRATSNVVVDNAKSKISAPPQPGSKAASVQHVPAPQPAIPQKIGLVSPRTKLFTPLRLVGLAILSASILTGFGLWYRYQYENAKAVVAKANDAGMQALREQDFKRAANELEHARHAVDVLGRKDRAADEIRRFAREANALANLASNSLSELLQEALASGKPNQTEPLRLSSLDKDGWVILDAIVVPADSGVDRFIVDTPVIFREGSVRIEIDSSIFRSDQSIEDSTRSPRFIFAAQIDKVSALSGDPLTAVLQFKGSTAFFWTSYDSYAAIGFRPIDEEDERQVKGLLLHQLEEVMKSPPGSGAKSK